LRNDQDVVITRFSDTDQKPYHIASKNEHETLVAKAIDFMKRGDVDKIVVSRIAEVRNQGQDLDRILECLIQAYPFALVYIMKTTDGECWVGATPEILIRRVDSRCQVMSLAGSQRFGGGNLEEAEWTEKEKAEQEVVTKDILTKLHLLGINDIAVKGPFNHMAGPLIHLRSDIEFTWKGDLSPVIQTLHPTPAVAGHPVRLAQDWIEKNEKHNRGYYAGLIGTMSENGDASLFVNLRCMRVQEDSFLLFVGGGVNYLSDPEKEWNETVLKSEVLTNILYSIA
jgi:isochorismate synthase